MAEVPAGDVQTGQRIRVDLDVHLVVHSHPSDGLVWLADGARGAVSLPADRTVELIDVAGGPAVGGGGDGG